MTRKVGAAEDSLNDEEEDEEKGRVTGVWDRAQAAFEASSLTTRSGGSQGLVEA